MTARFWAQSRSSAGIAACIATLSFAGLLGEKPLILGAMGLGLAFTFALPYRPPWCPGWFARATPKPRWL